MSLWQAQCRTRLLQKDPAFFAVGDHIEVFSRKYPAHRVNARLAFCKIAGHLSGRFYAHVQRIKGILGALKVGRVYIAVPEQLPVEFYFAESVICSVPQLGYPGVNAMQNIICLSYLIAVAQGAVVPHGQYFFQGFINLFLIRVEPAL